MVTQEKRPTKLDLYARSAPLEQGDRSSFVPLDLPLEQLVLRGQI